eukprot:TRINITY_DN2680_c0_g2_i1.p1 TRINITY_DN2680_c0_g2~~TRINITY_DN2680_c0_g2_i1.p1  ORF type:complete len:480 (+),score=122.04 TRINITY_DN2680_c0_g2_i1:183-1622(+)
MGGGITFSRYLIASFGATIIVVYNSFATREQFYSACLHLVTSKAPMAVLGNLLLASFLLFGKLIQKIFLGELRDAEVELLSDKLWGTAIDTLFIMTIFREEFNLRFISMFVILLFMKTNHWLCQERVDYMQQMVNITGGKHLRLFSLMCLLFVVDALFVFYAVHVSFKVPSMMILFGFEYQLLISAIVVTMIKYFFNMKEVQSQDQWENKGAYVLYLDFAAELYRLLVYMAFFGVILTHYGIPLHIIRQLYYSFSSFRDRAVEVMKYRAAMKDMKTRFKDATPQELASSETCIVCRSELKEGKKLPCGHILHFACLRSWLERKQYCPTCMKPVLEDTPSNVNNNNNVNNNANANNNNNLNNEILNNLHNILNNQRNGGLFLPPQIQENQNLANQINNNNLSQDVEQKKEFEQSNSKDINIASELQIMQLQLFQMQQKIQVIVNQLNKSNSNEDESELLARALNESMNDMESSTKIKKET